MKNWTIGKRITLGFAALLVVMAAVGTIAIVENRATAEKADDIVQHSLPGLASSGQLVSHVKENQNMVYAHILEDDDAGQKAIEKEMAEATALINADFAAYEKT